MPASPRLIAGVGRHRAIRSYSSPGGPHPLLFYDICKRETWILPVICKHDGQVFLGMRNSG
jgi:hypothetical protein